MDMDVDDVSDHSSPASQFAEGRNLRSKAKKGDNDRSLLAATKNGGTGRGRKTQLQTLNESVSASILPSLKGRLPRANARDRAGIVLLEREPLLGRACGGFRLFVRKFTDQQLLKCIRSPEMNTLKQLAPAQLRYLHTLRNAWKSLTHFERMDWEDQFARLVREKKISITMPNRHPSAELLEGPGGIVADEDEHRQRQFQWLSTVDSEHLHCPLCSFENPRRFSVNELLQHLSLSHFAVHLYACHCCSRTFTRPEALKVHALGGECPGFLSFLRENIKRKDNFVFDFAYASLICAECGLHLVLSPRCDQDTLAETLRNIILSHSCQSLVLCLTFSAMELAQPSIRVQFPRPTLLSESSLECPKCAISGGCETPVELEKHCAKEHKGTMEMRKCPECPASFFTQQLFCDHLLSEHAQLLGTPLATQWLRSIPQLPPALTNSKMVLIGAVGIPRALGEEEAAKDPLKWTPMEERTAREGQVRKSKRKRKKRRLHSPETDKNNKDNGREVEDAEEEEIEDESVEGEDEEEEEIVPNSSKQSPGSPSGSMSFGRWKEQMRRLEGKAFSSIDSLGQFSCQLDLPVVYSGQIIVHNSLDGALLTESVFQCSKCHTISIGEQFMRVHVSECHKIAATDPEFEHIWDGDVYTLFDHSSKFPFTPIRCRICSIKCCSIASLHRHYAQEHTILCHFERNKSTIEECAELMISREWANTKFDRELRELIDSNKMPPSISRSEMESECGVDQQFSTTDLSLSSLHSSLLHMLDDQQHQNCEDVSSKTIQCKMEVEEEPPQEKGQMINTMVECKMEIEEEEEEEEEEQGESPERNALITTNLEPQNVCSSSSVIIKQEVFENEEEEGEEYLSPSAGSSGQIQSALERSEFSPDPEPSPNEAQQKNEEENQQKSPPKRDETTGAKRGGKKRGRPLGSGKKKGRPLGSRNWNKLESSRTTMEERWEVGSRKKRGGKEKDEDANWNPRNARMTRRRGGGGRYQLRRKVTEHVDEKDPSEQDPFEQLNERVNLEKLGDDEQMEEEAERAKKLLERIKSSTKTKQMLLERVKNPRKKKQTTGTDEATSSKNGPDPGPSSPSPPPSYICFMCNFVEKSVDDFRRHLKTHPEQWAICQFCEHENGSNAKRQRPFDHPLHFLNHLREKHMDMRADQVVCPCCGLSVPFNSENQKNRAIASMFRHLMYECERVDVCLLCGQSEFGGDNDSNAPDEMTKVMIGEDAQQPAGDEAEQSAEKQQQEAASGLAEHRGRCHRLIFDRFICSSCKCGFYSRELFLRHRCEHALRCLCCPSFRFRSRGDFSLHFQKFKKQWKGIHGPMLSECELDPTKRAFVLNDDYLRWVEQLEKKQKEELVERETAKTVAEIKRKMAHRQEGRNLHREAFGEQQERVNDSEGEEEAKEEVRQFVVTEQPKQSYSGADGPKWRRAENWRSKLRNPGPPIVGLGLSTGDLMLRARSNEDAKVLRILSQASKMVEAEEKQQQRKKQNGGQSVMELDEIETEDGNEEETEEIVVRKLVGWMVDQTVKEVDGTGTTTTKSGKQGEKGAVQKSSPRAGHSFNCSRAGHSFNCSKCQMIFHSEQTLEQHKAMAHVEYYPLPIGTISSLCRRCCIAFHDHDQYAQHMKRDHPHLIACRRCSCVCESTEQYERHRAQHNTDFVCSLCLVRYTSELNLAHHLAKVHKKKLVYFCKSCGHCSTSLLTVLCHIFVPSAQCTKIIGAEFVGVCDAAQLRFLPPSNSQWKPDYAQLVRPAECRHVCLLASSDPQITCNVCQCPIPLDTWMSNFFPRDAPKFKYKEQCALAEDDTRPDCIATAIFKLIKICDSEKVALTDNKLYREGASKSLQNVEHQLSPNSLKTIRKRLERLQQHERVNYEVAGNKIGQQQGTPPPATTGLTPMGGSGEVEMVGEDNAGGVKMEQKPQQPKPMNWSSNIIVSNRPSPLKHFHHQPQRGVPPSSLLSLTPTRPAATTAGNCSQATTLGQLLRQPQRGRQPMMSSTRPYMPPRYAPYPNPQRQQQMAYRTPPTRQYYTNTNLPSRQQPLWTGYSNNPPVGPRMANLGQMVRNTSSSSLASPATSPSDVVLLSSSSTSIDSPMETGEGRRKTLMGVVEERIKELARDGESGTDNGKRVDAPESSDSSAATAEGETPKQQHSPNDGDRHATSSPPPQLVRMVPPRREQPVLPLRHFGTPGGSVRVPPHRMMPVGGGMGGRGNTADGRRPIVPPQYGAKGSSARAYQQHAPYCRHPPGYCTQKLGTNCIVPASKRTMPANTFWPSLTEGPATAKVLLPRRPQPE